MDIAKQTRRPWRSWTVIALVLMGLALAQACGKSGSSTGPTTNTSVQLKLRRAGGAELPGGCTGGTFTVKGPGGQVLATGSFGPDGKISTPVPVGQQVTIEVTVFCPGGALSGSITLDVGPEGAQGQIVIDVSRVQGVRCSPSTVAPDEEATCTCDASSPGTPSITWTGSVNPKTGKTVTFKDSSPGTHQVSCTINGIDTQSTTVTVEEPAPPAPVSGFIRLDNVDLCGECGLPPDLHISIDGIFVVDNLTVGDPPVTTPVTASVPHVVRARCGSRTGFALPSRSVTVAPGATANVAFDSSDCD